jgi:hypothetical protein
MRNTLFDAHDNLKNRIKFLSAYALFAKWFGPELVNKHFAPVPFDLVVELGMSPVGDNITYLKNKPHIMLPDGYEYITKTHPQDHSYTKTERVMCQRWIQSHHYQGLTHEKILYPCMLEQHPWLKRFTLHQYEVPLYGYAPEFYVDLKESIQGHCNLYVPYEAFFAGDVAAILERNRSYLKWYTHADLIWNEMQGLPIVKKFLTLVAKHNKV